MSRSNRQDVSAKLRQLACDPIEGMVRIARQAEGAGAHALAGKMYAELASYTAPKLKAIEIHGQLDVTPAMELTPEERRARIKLLAESLGMNVTDRTLEGQVVRPALEVVK